ncbi:MAG: dihydropteroate synthase [Comamonadaceae bacterium PBBC2]|nr:MAG: dihydropteroate synthase [Comamonadaceae bacterium PBBC2]
MPWQTTRFDLDLSQPLVMGIVNATPDSFSDGGRYDDAKAAIAHAERLVKAGADILDVGGESTRPGAQVVPAAQELSRLVPVLQELLRWQVPISVDTYKPEVMQAVLDLGIDIVNDIWALRQPGALAAVAAHPRCGVCLMHMHRDPQTMQMHTMEGNVVAAVIDFLQERVAALKDGGIASRRLVLDPGIGFGKTVQQNFQLLADQDQLLSLGLPILAGWSRKSSLGAVLTQAGQTRGADQRQFASVAAALLAVERGASIVRVHDVKETVDALKVWQAVRDNS